MAELIWLRISSIESLLKTFGFHKTCGGLRVFAAKETHSAVLIDTVIINLLATDFLFQILAHPVFKM